MKKIKITTEKIVVCEVDYSESVLKSNQAIDLIKKQVNIPEYDEIDTNMLDCVIRFIKYTHIVTVEV